MSNIEGGKKIKFIIAILVVFALVNLFLVYSLVSLSAKNKKIVLRIEELKENLTKLEEIKKANDDFFAKFDARVTDLIKANTKKGEDLAISNREDITLLQEEQKKHIEFIKKFEEKTTKTADEVDFLKKITQSSMLANSSGGKNFDKTVLDKISFINKRLDYFSIQFSVSDIVSYLNDKAAFITKLDKFEDAYSPNILSSVASEILASIKKEASTIKDDKEIIKLLEDLYVSNLSENKGKRIIKEESYFADLIKIKDTGNIDSYKNDIKNKKTFEITNSYIRNGKYFEAKKEMDNFSFTENESLFLEISKMLETKAIIKNYIAQMKALDEIELVGGKKIVAPNKTSK